MPTPMLGDGVIAATTVRLTAAGVGVGIVLGDGELDGLDDGTALPDAGTLGVGSTVGPGDEDPLGSGRPTVGVTSTSTTRGVGAPCAPTAPGGDAEDEGAPADGGLAITVVIVTVGTGGAATGTSGTNSITNPSSAHPTAPTMDR